MNVGPNVPNVINARDLLITLWTSKTYLRYRFPFSSYNFWTLNDKWSWFCIEFMISSCRVVHIWIDFWWFRRDGFCAISRFSTKKCKINTHSSITIFDLVFFLEIVNIWWYETKLLHRETSYTFKICKVNDYMHFLFFFCLYILFPAICLRTVDELRRKFKCPLYWGRISSNHNGLKSYVCKSYELNNECLNFWIISHKIIEKRNGISFLTLHKNKWITPFINPNSLNHVMCLKLKLYQYYYGNVYTFHTVCIITLKFH